MGFIEAVRSVLGKYVTFSGRAQRSEYWWFALFTIIVVLIGFGIDLMLNPGLGSMSTTDAGFEAQSSAGPVTIVLYLLIFLPSLAVAVRRLHDIDKAGWWILIGLIPVIGGIILLIWYCTKGTLGPNRFGDDPLAR